MVRCLHDFILWQQAGHGHGLAFLLELLTALQLALTPLATLVRRLPVLDPR